jgi:hypothetical protein
LTAFVPSAQAIDRFISSAPDTLYENKESVLLQAVLREYFVVGGRLGAVNALTRDGFDTLGAGSYLFAVDRYGRVRVARGSDGGGESEYRTGTAAEPPPVSHAMIFAGADLLTAGWMRLEKRSGETVIGSLNAQSGQYFYSSIAPTIRDDVTRYSDQYLVSLGHLFASLEGLGIRVDGVLIHKF